MGDGVANFHLLGILDAADNIAHLARSQLLTRYHVHLEHAHFVSVVLHTSVKELHLVALTNDAIGHFKVGNDTTERVEHRVEDECLQGCLFVACRMRYALNHSVQDVLDTFTRLARSTDNVLRIAANEVDYFVLHLIRHGRRHVYLVDNRNNLQVVVYGKI